MTTEPRDAPATTNEHAARPRTYEYGEPEQNLIRLARWLAILVTVPIAVLEIVEATRRGTETPWLVAQTVVMLVGAALILALGRQRPRIQAAAISTVLTAVGWLGLAHYGPLLASGLLIALSCVCWTYFFGRAGMIGSVTATVVLLVLTAWASLTGALGVAAHSAATPQTLDAWARMCATVGAGVVFLTVLVHGIQSRYRGMLDRATLDERRTSFLSRTTALLSESLDVDEIPGRLARLAVPFLGDWCSIVELADGGALRPVAGAHVDPAKLALLHEESLGALSDPEAARWMECLVDERRPAVVPVLTDENERLGAGARARLRALGADTWMAVPLVTRGRPCGLVILGATGRRFGTDELHLASELARRAAIALDNAHLYHQAVEAVRSRDEFLTVASHELRTPLTAMLLAARSLSRECTAPRARTRAAVVERQARRLSRLVGDMLDVSRLHARDIVLERDDVDLVEVVRRAIDAIEPALRSSGSTVSFQAPASLHGSWDRARIERVIAQLVDNAVKFGAGAPIEITISEHDARAKLVVHDHGIGISPARLVRLFERFGRGVSSTHYGGLGLGLYLVKRVIEAHGGTIDADSDPVRGTTFTIELPTSARAEEPVRAAASPSASGLPQLASNDAAAASDWS